MRGQDSEKQVHREGKTKADDENRPASGPSASSSAHQIRSRITVVCAECKRLKLKCDRRNPCGSCTKRDTVPRCIYSTAAAEKVDLHSLNNRLMQVESILAMVTAGQTPPPFQSSYPLAHIALPSPSTTSGQARSRTPLMSPISILLDDLKDIWLSNTHNLSEGENEGASGSSIKLEPLGMDNLLRLRESDMDPSEEIPRGLEPPTGLKVPPLQAYYLHPEGSASRSIPAASDALFALLPSALDRAKYVCCAINADPTLTMLTDWERIERAAQFPTHGNPHSSLGSSRPTRPTATATTGDNSQDTHMPIPIFVALIYAIAIGMLGQPDGHAEDSPSPTYLDELGSQVLKVCQDYLLDGGAPRGGNIADGVNFVSANLLQFKFRLLSLRQKSASKAVSAEGLRSLFLSIGRLVNLGRSFGLAKEPSGDDDLSQIQRLLWWEILFYDAFISDALNQPPLISPSSYTTEIPKLSLPELVADGTTSAVEVITTEGVQVETQMTRSKSSKNTLDFGCYCGLHGKKHKEDISSMLKDRSRTALFAQSRLTRLLQYLREALAHTNCECCISNHGSGYTLDKATEVEVQIREFMDKLPSGLKLFPSPKIDQARPPWMAAIAAKVAILAHRMIIATYLPLMRPPIDENTGEPSRARTYAAQPWSSPNRTTLEAAQSVLAAADLLRRFKDFDSITRLVAFHPLSKAVFDALVICAHTGLGNGVGYSVNLIKITCEDVMKGLDLVPALGGLSSDMAQIVACIRQKVTNRPVSPIQDEPAIFDHGQSLKRKRHQPPSPTTSGDNQLSPSTETPAVASTPATGSPSGETDSDRPSQRRVSRIITELPSDQERSSRRELERYHPSVGVRNRGKGGPPWAKKLTPRHVSHANLEAAHLDDSSTMPLSRPVSSLSGSLEPAVSPRAPDSYMRYPIQQGLNSGMLPHEPSGHDYRPSSAHPHSEGDLEGRYRQRRRLSYDETAASNVSSDGSGFGQRGTFSNLLPGRNPAYVSLQGSIQGSIQISRPPASEVPYRDPPSHPRSVDDRAFHRMQQQAQPFTAREDHHFDTTLNLTAVLNPAGETVANKALAQVDDPPLYPGYRSSDQHSFDNPILTDPMQPSLVPVNPTPFSSGNQPQASQWSENFPSSFPLDDRSSQFWNADNYYQ